jgi:hypothetical protein
MVQSPSCSKRDRDIFVKLSNTEYTVGSAVNFQINGVVRSPSVAGSYFVEVQLISPNGNLQESYTAVLNFASSPIVGYSFLPVPGQCNPLALGFAATGIIAMHEISFTTPYYMPASIVQTDATQLVSYIKLTYTATVSTNISPSFGYGFTVPTMVPCRSVKGLNPVVGTSLNCTVFPDITASGVVNVIVQNYAEVAAGGQIMILLPHIANPMGTINFGVRIITKQLRLLTVSSSISSSFTFLTRDLTGFNTSVIATPGVDYISTSQKNIYSSFQATFQASVMMNVVANTRILMDIPKYDVGLLPREGVVTCSLLGTPYTCYQFKNGLDWIYGSLSPDQPTLAVKPTSPWLVTNLVWPRSVTTTLIRPWIVWLANWDTTVTPNMYTINRVLNYPSIPSPVSTMCTKAVLNVDKKWRLQVDVTYTFTFRCPNDIPSGATVQLTLPSQYNLLASFPSMQLMTPEFDDMSSSQILGNVTTANTVTMFNVGRVYNNTEFRIILKGIRNPGFSGTMSNYNLYIALNGNAVSYYNNIAAVTLDNSTSTYPVGLLDISKITVFPINRLVESDYTFAIIPQTKLSKGAEIHIVFPADYSSLPQNPNCFVSGGINTFDSCSRLGNEIILKLNSNYNTGTIYILVTGITNPDFSQTSSFEAFTYYDGSVIDQTRTASSSSRRVSLSAKPSLLSMRQFFFDPSNEGEVATYTISFMPTNNIATGMNVYIKFPPTFDLRLGKSVTISVTTGLAGDIKTGLANRIVTISNFNAYEVTLGTPITVVLTGVVNPNKPAAGQSGYISVGTIYPGSNIFLDYLAKAGSIQSDSAPGWLTLHQINASNYYSRAYVDYSVNFTASEKIPRSDYGGMIWVDLPTNYQPQTTAIKCSNNTANLGSSLLCHQDSLLMKINNHKTDLIGNLAFTLKTIKNPLDQVTTQSFFIRTYDGSTRQIIQRSFENLDPLKLNFNYPGPLIVVNNDQPIYVEKGTQSKDLYLVITEICALNLTFVPATPGFSFVPGQIKLNVGEVTTKFRVSIPEGFAEGQYTVEWTTQGDQNPPIYTPIKKTIVIVTGKGSKFDSHRRYPTDV